VFYGCLRGAAGFSRAVALKRIEPQGSEAHGGARALLEKTRSLSRVRHPNVVPTLDAVEEDDGLYLVMDYVAGETLDRLLGPLASRGERVPPRIACALVAGVLRGLHAAHEARSSRGEPLGIVHGDVSPRNVLVGADGVPRLLDFAFPRPSLPYMAPEQGHGEVTPRSDVFSAGMILWEALTGRSALAGEGDAATVDTSQVSVVEAPSKLVLGVPREVDVITMRALRTDPRERYVSAKDMARDLEACLGGAADSEIAAWVAKYAGETLAERAAMVSAVERHASMSTPTSTSTSTSTPTSTSTSTSTSTPPPTHLASARRIDASLGNERTVLAAAEEGAPLRFGQLVAYAVTGFAIVAVAGIVTLLVRASYLGRERAARQDVHTGALDASRD
jgi:eukaryotic-like serine/threonine-protein kinase